MFMHPLLHLITQNFKKFSEWIQSYEDHHFPTQRPTHSNRYVTTYFDLPIVLLHCVTIFRKPKICRTPQTPPLPPSPLPPSDTVDK